MLLSFKLQAVGSRICSNIWWYLHLKILGILRGITQKNIKQLKLKLSNRLKNSRFQIISTVLKRFLNNHFQHRIFELFKSPRGC
jgi:hypothetical protein